MVVSFQVHFGLLLFQKPFFLCRDFVGKDRLHSLEGTSAFLLAILLIWSMQGLTKSGALYSGFHGSKTSFEDNEMGRFGDLRSDT